MYCFLFSAHLQVAENNFFMRVPSEVANMLQVPKHKNVIRLYDFCDRDGRLVMVLERPCPSMDLTSFLDADPGATRLKSKVAKSLFSQILNAVLHCHGAGIVHDDIKTEKVVIELTTGRAILIDFRC